MTRPTFNLIEEPWIPCIRMDGSAVELGLRETLAQAHQLREVFDNSPLVTAALMRLMLAVLQRVVGYPGMDGWKALWERTCFPSDKLDEYWLKVQDRFDLYDKHNPFYQCSKLKTKSASPISRLSVELACGSNKTLFDHSLDDNPVVISHATAAKNLIAIQCFGFSCRLEFGYVDRAPLFDKAVFFLKGYNLFESIMLNLLYKNPFPVTEEDQPAWERDDFQIGKERLPRGYMDYLTWQSRSVLLSPPASNMIGPQEIQFAAGEKMAETPFLDPQMYYKKSEKYGFLPVALSSSKALWRDSSTFFSPVTTTGRCPLSVEQVANLVHRKILPPDYVERVQGVCTIKDNLSKKNKPSDIYAWRRENIAIPLFYYENEDFFV